MKQHLLSFLVTVILLLGSGMASMAQTATKPSGAGTSGDPYLIASLLDLKWIAEQVNGEVSEFLTIDTNGNKFMFLGKYFKQTANIDASATTGWNSGKGWAAIGGTDNYYVFSGSYDGQGYTISNLYINNPSANLYGFFGYCANATLKNIGLTNVSMIANSDIGGLVGYMEPGTISNCYVTGAVTAKGSTGFVGGLCGEAFATNVDNCYAACTVVADKGAAGGLIAYLSVSGLTNSSLTNSYSSGSVTVNSEAWQAGGLLGEIYSGTSVEYCFSESSVSTNGVLHNEPYNADVSNIGGLIGSNGGTVANCYAKGSVTVTNAENESEIGGLLGENSGAVSYSYSTGSLSVTPLTGNTPAVGGFVGVNYDEYSYAAIHNPTNVTFAFIPGIVNNTCYWNSSVYANGCGSNSFTYLTPYTATFSATGKTTAEMQTQSTFTGWDFVNHWKRIDTKNNKYPYLAWQVLPSTSTINTTAAALIISTSATLGGNITADGGATVTERGVVYSLASANINPQIGGTGVSKVAIGTGTGSFNQSVGSLTAGTLYYVNAYAINSAGTSYGSEVTFTTLTIPTVSSVTPPPNAIYKVGDALDFTVNFSEAVTVAGGTPYIPITIGTKTANASYASGNGSSSLVFRYTILASDLDADGIEVGSAITANSATLKSSSNVDAALKLNSIGSTTNVKVDAMAPNINSFNPPITGTYISGQNMNFIVNFSEPVNVDITSGKPYMLLTVGSRSVHADYQSGSGTTALHFNYPIALNDYDADGIALTLGVTLNGGSITDIAGNTASIIAGPSIVANGVNVDAVAPTVATVVVPSAATYLVGQNLDFTVNFSKNATVVTTGGTPYLSLIIGGVEKHATYVTGSGTAALMFRYTVVSGDSGDLTTASSLVLNSGTIKDNLGNPAILTFATPTTAGITVDAVAPTISLVSSTSPNGVYKLGDIIPITLTFNEITIVKGTPTLSLNSGGTANYSSGSGTSTLTFNYTVVASESISDLDYSSISALSLGGGTIKDEAGNAAVLTLPTLGGVNSLGGNKDILIGIVPTITTQTASAILGTMSIGNLTITNLGYPNPTQYGIVWSTSPNPTVALSTKTTEGTASATGAFTTNITGLAPGTTYYVKAYATNAVSTVYGVELSFTTTIVPPAIPTAVTALPDNAQATVSFTAPASNGGSAITGYTVTSSPGNFTGTGTASPITVTGLTNGTTYTFTVTATNSAGTSTASATSNSVTPNATQTITFTNPGTQSFGTAPQLSATATSGLSVTFSTTTPDVCSITSGGILTFKKAGSCTILADQAGSDAFLAAPTVSRSFTVNAVIPGTPIIGAATAGDTQASVSFTAPASTGGADVTYTVTSSPGNFTGTGTTSPITVTGLTNGTTYTFTVTATNSAGTSTASAASNSVTAFTLPAATTLTASAITASTATLNGTVTANGASTVVSFEYGPTISYGTTITAGQSPVTGVDATSVSKTITRLTANTTYHYRVVAVNAGGTINGLDQTFKTDLGTGLDNATVTMLSLYPNPTTEGFYIHAGEANTLLTICDLNGRLVLTQQVTGNSYVNIDSLQKGVYVVKTNGLVAKLVKK